MLKLMHLWAALLAATLLSACATKPASRDTDLPAAVRLADFQRVYIAPVSADLASDIGQITYGQTSERPVSSADLARKSADLHASLSEAFARYFSLAEAPAEGVLVVQPELLRLASTRPTQADFDRNPRLDFSSSVYGGGAEISIVFLHGDDALAVVRERHFGDFNDGRPRLAVWADADRAFPLLSRRLARYASQN